MGSDEVREPETDRGGAGTLEDLVLSEPFSIVVLPDDVTVGAFTEFYLSAAEGASYESVLPRAVFLRP